MKYNSIKIFYIISFLLLISCNNTKNNSDVEVNNEIVKDQLHKEIIKFVDYVDSIPRSKELQNVILVDFENVKGKLFVSISTAYYYKSCLNGYWILKDYLIAFCNIELYNENGIKEYNLINSNPPLKYDSEQEVDFSPFEPTIKKFQILNDGQLLFIEKIEY